jgi:hypothetical protein
VKWQGRVADHSPPSSAEVKNAWSYNSTPPILLNGLKKHRDNFTLYIIYPCLPNGLFSLGFPKKILYAFLISSIIMFIQLQISALCECNAESRSKMCQN